MAIISWIIALVPQLASLSLLTSASPAATVADGARMSVGEKAWSVISELVDDIVVVSDEEILRAVHFVVTRTKLVVEPTGAMTVAALLSRSLAGGPAAAVLSGGNLDPGLLGSLADGS